eukprot:Gb_16269 [translate_table: standard]
MGALKHVIIGVLIPVKIVSPVVDNPLINGTIFLECGCTQ